jgi:uncharacterized membrane protein YqjE
MRVLAPLVIAILRHLQAYADVASEDATVLARKLAAILVAAASAFVALLMLCIWLLALAWDGPWRTWTAAGLALAFVLLAVALALPVLRPGTRSPDFFPRIRTELGRDRELLDRAFDGRRGSGEGEDHEPAAR